MNMYKYKQINFGTFYFDSFVISSYGREYCDWYNSTHFGMYQYGLLAQWEPIRINEFLPLLYVARCRQSSIIEGSFQSVHSTDRTQLST